MFMYVIFNKRKYGETLSIDAQLRKIVACM